MPTKDQAVSSVVSAVLLFTIFVSAFTIWSFEQLPDIIDQKEHNHALGMADTFTQARSDVTTNALAGRTGAVLIPVRLAPSPVPLLQPTGAVGSLGFDPDAFRLTMDFGAGQAHLFAAGGGFLGNHAAPSGTLHTNVRTMDVLSVEVTDGPGPGFAGDAVTVTFEPAGTNLAATVQKVSGSSCTVTVTGASVTTTTVPCSTGTTDRIDLLNPAFGLTSRMALLPESFTWRADGVGGGQVAAIWRVADGGTRTFGDGVATTLPTPIESDTLRFDPRYAEFPQRQVLLDGGAVINVEPSGQSMATSPDSIIGCTKIIVQGTKVCGNDRTFRWIILDIDGDEKAATGAGGARINMEVVRTQDFVFESRQGNAFTDLSFSVQSDGYKAWAQHWRDQIVLNSISSNPLSPDPSNDAAFVTENAGGRTTTLTLSGSGEWLVHLTVVSVSAVIE